MATTGSIIIDNVSYSGADIKVVVHLYPSTLGKRKKALSDRRETLRVKNLSRVESRLSQIESRMQSIHSGTPEHNRLQREKGALRKKLTLLQPEPDSHSSGSKASQVDQTKVLMELQTLSISTHRDKRPVRSCGTVYPQGFVRGGRQIAGSMIFTVFNTHVFYSLLDADTAEFDASTFQPAITDQLPPLDVTISFANELGAISRMGVFGLEFMDEGQVMSIEDMFTENTMHFVARDIDLMRGVFDPKRNTDTGRLQDHGAVYTRASDLLREPDYKQVQDAVSPFTRFSRRRNPFL